MTGSTQHLIIRMILISELRWRIDQRNQRQQNSGSCRLKGIIEIAGQKSRENVCLGGFPCMDIVDLAISGKNIRSAWRKNNRMQIVGKAVTQIVIPTDRHSCESNSHARY